MPRLKWDQPGERLYETGVRDVVHYPFNSTTKNYPVGYAWNGCTAVNEKPTGGDPTDIYADDIKYLSLRAAEKFEAGIEAYTYPDSFKESNGEAEPVPGIVIGQQTRKTFGLCYRTAIGNDTDFDEHGYKINLIWGASVSPSERNHTTINDSPDAVTFSWDMTTTPVEVPGFKKSAFMSIDSTKVDEDKLKALLDILYGTDPVEAGEGQEASEGTVARLPMPSEILDMFKPTPESDSQT